VLVYVHLAILDTVHPGIGDPADVTVTELCFQQPLGVANTAKTEVADIGL